MTHTWQLDEHGEPDHFGYEVVGETQEHNGPRCTACRFFFCEHCHPQWWASECPGELVPFGWRPAT